MSSEKMTTLKTASSAVLSSLKHLTSIENLDYRRRLHRECERFLAWAGSLGALQSGHSSLDWRLRDAEEMKATILEFLLEVQNHLEQLQAISTGARAPFEHQTQLYDVSGGNSSSDSSDDGISGSELAQRCAAIEDIIDDLYGLSYQVRRPGIQNASHRARSYRYALPDSDLEVGQAYARVDRAHVLGVLSDVYNRHAHERGEGNEAYDNIDPVLLDRLVNALTTRRRQIEYWKRHTGKLARMPTIELDDRRTTSDGIKSQLPSAETQGLDLGRAKDNRSTHSSNNLTNTQTEATLFQPAEITMDDNASLAPTISTVFDLDGEEAKFPGPPSEAQADKPFTCPYCTLLCPPNEAKRKRWKKHIREDAQPYLCTYVECLQADELYGSRERWLAHENVFHRQGWQCHQHQDQIYHSESRFIQHLRSAHPALPPREHTSLVELAMVTLQDSRSDCPLCKVPVSALSRGQNLTQHIVSDLERIAAFIFPPQPSEDQEDEVVASSKDSGMTSIDAMSGGATDQDLGAESDRETQASRGSGGVTLLDLSPDVSGSGVEDFPRSVLTKEGLQRLISASNAHSPRNVDLSPDVSEAGLEDSNESASSTEELKKRTRASFYTGGLQKVYRVPHALEDLYMAIKAGAIDIVIDLLKKDPTLLKTQEPFGGITPIHLAVVNGRRNVVRHLLSLGCAIESIDFLGHTLLMTAVQCGDLAMVEDLLQAGADPWRGTSWQNLPQDVLWNGLNNAKEILEVLHAAQNAAPRPASPSQASRDLVPEAHDDDTIRTTPVDADMSRKSLDSETELP